MNLRNAILNVMGMHDVSWTPGELLGALLEQHPGLTRDELVTTLEDLAGEGRVKQTWNDVWKKVA